MQLSVFYFIIIIIMIMHVYIYGHLTRFSRHNQTFNHSAKSKALLIAVYGHYNASNVYTCIFENPHKFIL